MKEIFLLTILLLLTCSSLTQVGHAQSYKIEVTKVDVSFVPSSGGDELGTFTITVFYRNNNAENITSGVQVCQWLSYDPNVNDSEMPIGITSTGPIYLPSSNSTGYVMFSLQDRRIITGQHYKAWIFLWNQLPSESGIWEPYAMKVEVTETGAVSYG